MNVFMKITKVVVLVHRTIMLLQMQCNNRARDMYNQ